MIEILYSQLILLERFAGSTVSEDPKIYVRDIRESFVLVTFDKDFELKDLAAYGAATALSAQRILDAKCFERLPVLHILGVQNGSAALECRTDDQRVPEKQPLASAQLMADRMRGTSTHTAGMTANSLTAWYAVSRSSGVASFRVTAT